MSFRKKKHYVSVACTKCRGWGKINTLPCKNCAGTDIKRTLIKKAK